MSARSPRVTGVPARLSRIRLSGVRLSRLGERPAAQFFATLTRSVPGLAAAWWLLLVVRSLVPAALAIATGLLVGRLDDGADLTVPLVVFGVVFVLSQVGPPVHQVVGTLLGHRFSSVLNDRLMAATLGPDGIGHLERGDLTNDLTTARDFDLGWSAPPMYLNIDFIAQGLVMLLGGIASALVLVGFAWWAPLLLLAAWGSTHWLLRESGVWRDRNTDAVKAARRHTSYAYDLATEPAAAKEVRLFGLAPWLLDRFTDHRLHLHQLQYDATRLRERSLGGALVIVLAANALLFWVLAERGYDGQLDLQAVVTYAGAAFGASSIAFGGLSWALDGAAAPVTAIRRLEPEMASAGALTQVGTAPAAHQRTRRRSASATSPSPTPRGAGPCSRGSTSRSRPVPRWRSSVRTAPARPPSPSSCAGSTTPTPARSRSTASTCETSTSTTGGPTSPRCSRTSCATSCPCATTSPRSAPTTRSWRRRSTGPVRSAWPTWARRWPRDTPTASTCPGGQWQRVALARAIAKVGAGADVVLLDEPTAMLDVRGESEIFRRVLDSTAQATTILVSHRFSTVRQASLICVVEHGRAIELGSHDELMTLGGRYHTMYDLQASRFVEVDEHGEEIVHDVL